MRARVSIVSAEPQWLRVYIKRAPVATRCGRCRFRVVAGRGGPCGLKGLPAAVEVLPPGNLLAGVSLVCAPRRVEPSCKEKWPLSDPGRFGSEAHRPALFAGREPYDPDRGRSGYFRPVSGLAPGALEFRGMRLWERDLCLVAPEGLELRDPAGLDSRGVPVPGLAPGVVGGRGRQGSFWAESAGGDNGWRCVGRGRGFRARGLGAGRRRVSCGALPAMSLAGARHGRSGSSRSCRRRRFSQARVRTGPRGWRLDGGESGK